MHRCVGALVIRASTILLALRSPHRLFYPNVWDVFGGHVEKDETPEEALLRELKEELGITARAWAYLDTLVLDMRESTLECRFYLVSDWLGVPVNCQLHEHSAIQWFDLDSASRLALAHPHPIYPTLFQRCLTGPIKAAGSEGLSKTGLKSCEGGRPTRDDG